MSEPAGPPEDLEALVRQLNRSAVSGPRPKEDEVAEPELTTFDPAADEAARHRLEEWLAEAVRRQASDLLVVPGHPPMLRLAGALTPLDGRRLTPAEAGRLLLSLLDSSRRRRLERRRAVDLGWGKAGVGRFRGNIHHQNGALAGAFRVLPEAVPSLDDLGLPPSASALAALDRGLVLVTGPTGSGKTTTLAALVGEIHRRRRAHIITVEDPVEFRYGPGQGVIEQIEIGRDAPRFAGALRSILRQDPDVILVGEMRDRETIGLVLTAAETGHLVLSTLHTNDAAQSVDRIVDVFPADQQSQIRGQLSLALTCVVSQRLIPATTGGRVLAAEVLWAGDAIRHLIRAGRVHELRAQMVLGQGSGNLPMEASLALLVRQGKVSEAEAAARAPHPEEFRRFLSGGSGVSR